MTISADLLIDLTAAWRSATDAALRCPQTSWRHALDLAREGIRLRRQWDVADWDAAERREILRLLPPIQSACRQILLEQATAGAAKQELAQSVMEQVAADDEYLADLLNDHDLSGRSAAFAAACFRDDLNWLATQVAILDGHQGDDFSSRVLGEQEGIQRELEEWKETQPVRAAKRPSGETFATRAAQILAPEVDRLRELALARRVEALLERPDPQDWHDWLSAWQAAGRMAARLAAEPAASPESTADTAGDHPRGSLTGDARRSVEQLRNRAAEQWAAHVAGLPPDEFQSAIRQTADELADHAAESMTFLDDVPPAAAIRTLELLREDAATCLQAAQESDRPAPANLRRTLQRRQSAAGGELQDRRLALRLESLLGRRGAAVLERLMLFLLLVFIVMMLVEGPLVGYEARWRGIDPEQPGASLVEKIFAWIDLAVCLVFFAEFTLKMALADGRWLYLKRNWLTGLLPAIPVGFLAYASHTMSLIAVEGGEWLVLVRGLRYLRLAQMARWLRIARPALRMARAIGFVLIASDRLVRRLAPLLNRNLVLFERASFDEAETPQREAFAALRERFHTRAGGVRAALLPGERFELLRARVDDLTAMLQTRIPVLAVESRPVPNREIRFEEVVQQLLSATPAGVSERVGRNLARSIARWCRALDVPVVRRLPFLRELAVAGRLPNPYDATAEAANRVGLFFERLLERVYWVADLYGTVTAPQLVDSMGDWMVKGTAGPTRRFLMFGTLFVIITQLASLLPSETLNTLTHVAERFVGAPLIVLGTLCMLPLLIGLWFRQIAGEATDFFTRVAEAQFLSATKVGKRRVAGRHRELLDRRVVLPELALGQAAGLPEDSGVTAGCPTDSNPKSVSYRVEMLWQDYLEGAPFHRSDTRTTMQLLGNLDLLSLYNTRLTLGRSRRKRLRRLDLSGSRASLRGPYLWFHFISRSLAHQTARLIVEYDAFTIPLDRIATADDREIRDYVRWLSRRLRQPIEEWDLPAQLAERFRAIPPHVRSEPRGREKDIRRRGYQGTDFTAIHFLSADSDLETDIRRSYGDQVADLMHRDRRDNIRRVFRSYPFHRWPKQRRTVNFLSFYQRHFLGGRVLWFPLTLLRWGFALSGRLVRLFATGVHEVLHPDASRAAELDETDPFAVAVRKIHRMREPLFMECLAMRAEFDPEYLGVVFPGGTRLQSTGLAPIEEDLALIGAEPDVKRRLVKLAAERRRQCRELRHWLGRFGGEPRSRESLRAMTVAYTINFRGIRAELEAVRTLEQAFQEAIDDAPEGDARRSPQQRRGFLGRLRGPDRLDQWLDRLFSRPPFAEYEDAERRVCRQVVRRRRGVLSRAVRRLAQCEADPVERSRQELESIARDPASWSRQLLALRTVQTMSVVDLKTYCDLVAELGDYFPDAK